MASTNQLNSREAQIQELKTGHAALEKDLKKKDEKLKQQEEARRELEKQQVPAAGPLYMIGSPVSLNRTCRFMCIPITSSSY